MTTCASCGGSLKPLAKFCSQCGAKAGDSASAVGTGSASSAARRLQVSASARIAIGGTLFVLPSIYVLLAKDHQKDMIRQAELEAV